MLKYFNRYDRCKRPLAVTSQKQMCLDSNGIIVHEENMKQNMTSWDLTYYLLRANFDGAESGYCRVPETRTGYGVAVYEYDHIVTGLQEGEEGNVKIFFQQQQNGMPGTITGDLAIGADGPSSTVRKVFYPEVKRKLVGYCALRGTVPEDEASPSTNVAFQERFTFFHADGI